MGACERPSARSCPLANGAIRGIARSPGPYGSPGAPSSYTRPSRRRSPRSPANEGGTRSAAGRSRAVFPGHFGEGQGERDDERYNERRVQHGVQQSWRYPRAKNRRRCAGRRRSTTRKTTGSPRRGTDDNDALVGHRRSEAGAAPVLASPIEIRTTATATIESAGR